MKLNWIFRGARLAPLFVVIAGLNLLTGCISYKSTGATPAPGERVQLTGSHLAVAGNSEKAAALSGAAPLTVYAREDLERSGASDLAGFLARVPLAQAHR